MTHVITNLIVSFASIFLDSGLNTSAMTGRLLPAAVKCPVSASTTQQLAQLPLTCPAAHQFGSDFDCGYGWIHYPDMYGYEECGEDNTADASIASESPFQVVSEESELTYDHTNPFRVVSENDLAAEIAVADFSIFCDNLAATRRAVINAAGAATDRLLDLAVAALTEESVTESQAALALAELKEMSIALLSRAELASVEASDAMPGQRIRMNMIKATCRNVPALGFRAVEPRVVAAGESPFVVIHMPRSSVAARVPAIPAGEFEPTMRISRRILNRATVPAIPAGEYQGCIDIARTPRTIRVGTIARPQLRMQAMSHEGSPFVAVEEVTVHMPAWSTSPFSPFIEVITERHVARDSAEQVEEVSDAADAIPADTDSAAVSSEAAYVASQLQSLGKAILAAINDTFGQRRVAAADAETDISRD